MILGQVSYLDCFVFLIFLAPQLLYHVGLFSTLSCAIRALPFLRFRIFVFLRLFQEHSDKEIVIKLPIRFLYQHTLVPRKRQTPFVQQASLFEDFVVRCVRYAFANIPSRISHVFFSKLIALPFLRFRMLRHGYLLSPVHWYEVKEDRMKGLWIIEDPFVEPDIVIYYAHGGGFSLGSSYFYLEFLLAWLHLLKDAGYRNPAIFSLEYSLVPGACYPTQLQQTITGYRYALSRAPLASKICISGDSAGGTLILSLLLHLARQSDYPMPGMAVLISPWTTLASPQDKNTPSDYLDAETLHLYARQYAGSKIALDDPLVSPGNCKELEWWKRASPEKGFVFMYGAEEVFAPEIRDMVGLFKKAGIQVESREEEGGIHAWPVAALFLSSTREERQKGLKNIVSHIREML